MRQWRCVCSVWSGMRLTMCRQAELESDPVTKKPRASPFHGFSPSGDVQATYVYAWCLNAVWLHGCVPVWLCGCAAVAVTASVYVDSRVMECRYVNYGRVEDYQALEAKGIDVSGHIVLVRDAHRSRASVPRDIIARVPCCSVATERYSEATRWTTPRVVARWASSSTATHRTTAL